MGICNRDVWAFLNEKAPFDTAEDWDNAGLLVGDPAAPVTGITVCLDVTPAAVDYAVSKGTSLLVSHHPVIFQPLKALSGLPYRLAQAKLSVLSAHTNLDAAAGGVNDTLAARLGLQDVTVLADGICRQGKLPQPETPEAFARRVAAALHTPVRVRCGDRPVSSVALCGGAGADLLLASATADALVSGEWKHHEWLAAAVTAVEAGHYETEVPVVDTLTGWLTARFPEVAVCPFADTPPCRFVTEEA